MIKGHTKIELTNVKTGEVQVVEDDNIVTNAPMIYENASKIRGYNEYAAAKSFAGDVILKKDAGNKQVLLADAYFGGILLFADPIDENANYPYVNSTNEMVGNGSVYDAMTETKEYGAYNQEESTYVVSEDGIITRKYVYDFGTSKANGTISSVCLCNYQYGFIGDGNDDISRALNSKANYNAYMDNVTGSYGSTNKSYHTEFFNLDTLTFRNAVITENANTKRSRMILYVDVDRNKEYFIPIIDDIGTIINEASTSLKIYENDFGRNKVNLLRKTNDCSRMIEITIPQKIKTIISNLTNTSKKLYLYKTIYTYENGKLIIAFAESEQYSNYYCVTSSDKICVWEINLDLSTMTSSGNSVKELSNTSGYNLYLYSSSITTPNAVIYKNHLYMARYGSNLRTVGIYKINLDNAADVVAIDMSNVLSYMNNVNVNSCKIKMFATKERIYFDLGTVADSSKNAVFVIKNDKAKILNGICIKSSNDGSDMYDLNGNIFSNNVFIAGIYSGGSYNNAISGSLIASYYSTKLVYNPFMVSTINNLSSPVTKTADMTMKITYTLTSAEEKEGS